MLAQSDPKDLTLWQSLLPEAPSHLVEALHRHIALLQ